MDEGKVNLVFKLVAIIGIVVITISISYYFVIYIPHKDDLNIQMLMNKETVIMEMEKEKELAEKKLKAAEIAQKLRKEFNNVHSVYYNEATKEFTVTYYAKGKMEESALENFGADRK